MISSLGGRPLGYITELGLQNSWSLSLIDVETRVQEGEKKEYVCVFGWRFVDREEMKEWKSQQTFS